MEIGKPVERSFAVETDVKHSRESVQICRLYVGEEVWLN